MPAFLSAGVSNAGEIIQKWKIITHDSVQTPGRQAAHGTFLTLAHYEHGEIVSC